MRWHYKEIEKRKGVRYDDCRSVTNPPTKNRKVSLLGTGGMKESFFVVRQKRIFSSYVRTAKKDALLVISNEYSPTDLIKSIRLTTECKAV